MRPFGHDSAGGLSKLVALLPKSMQIVHNWSEIGHFPGSHELNADIVPLVRAFTGRFNKHKEPGLYRCLVCGQSIFSSATKYDSGSGWPSFYDVIDTKRVKLKSDLSHGTCLRGERWERAWCDCT